MGVLVNTKSELTKTILFHREEIKKLGVVKLGFFCSFARNEVNMQSDVDFFIEISPAYKTLRNFTLLSALFASLTGRKIEIVTPQSLNKFIGKYILEEVEYVTLAA